VADEETKRHMLDILKRFSQLDVENGTALEAETSSLGFLGELTPEEVDSLSLDELVSRIGPEALSRFEDDLKNNPKFIEAALQEWRPWWLSPLPVQDSATKLNQSAVPDALEELPPLSNLTSERLPEMLWNNLVELLYLYIYFSRLYAGDLMPHAVGIVTAFLSLSRVLSSQQFTHASVIHAIRSAEASVAMDSEMYLSTETKTMLLEDLLEILSNTSYLLPALGDLQRVFEKAGKIRKSTFFSAKKIYFYNVWLNDEIENDCELVDTITVSMKALITGYIEHNTTSAEELANLRMPIK
jgi:hypothetical protein